MQLRTLFGLSQGSSYRNLLVVALVFLVMTPSEAQKEQLSVQSVYHQYTDGKRTLEIFVAEETPRGIIARKDVLCNLYLTEISREGMMGSLITDENGIAVFPLVNKFQAADDTISEYRFIVRITNDERFNSIDDTTVFQKAEMEVSYVDTETRGISTTVFHFDEDGDKIPLKGLVVSHFVETENEDIPVNGQGDLTDGRGETLVLYQEKIQGDSNGNLVMLTRVESPVYGTLEDRHILQWGANPNLFDSGFWGLKDENGNYPVYIFAFILIIPAIVFFYGLGYIIEKFTTSEKETEG